MAVLGTGKVQSRGQITLPKSIRIEADITLGDLVLFKVLGPSRIEIETIPVKPLSYFLERFRSDAAYDDDQIREAWQEEAARNAIGE